MVFASAREGFGIETNRGDWFVVCGTQRGVPNFDGGFVGCLGGACTSEKGKTQKISCFEDSGLIWETKILSSTAMN